MRKSGKRFSEIISIGEIDFTVTGKYMLDSDYIIGEPDIEFYTIEAKIINESGEEIIMENGQSIIDSFEYFDTFKNKVIDILEHKIEEESENDIDDNDIEDELCCNDSLDDDS